MNIKTIKFYRVQEYLWRWWGVQAPLGAAPGYRFQATMSFVTVAALPLVPPKEGHSRTLGMRQEGGGGHVACLPDCRTSDSRSPLRYPARHSQIMPWAWRPPQLHASERPGVLHRHHHAASRVCPVALSLCGPPPAAGPAGREHPRPRSAWEQGGSKQSSRSWPGPGDVSKKKGEEPGAHLEDLRGTLAPVC